MEASNQDRAKIDDEEILLRPIVHVTLPGLEYRNLMRRLYRSYNFWVRCPKDRQRIFGDIGNTFHNISIVLDDIEDGTVLRRGIPAAHMVYGVALSVQATIYNAFLLFQSLLQHLKDNEDVVTDDFVKVGIEFFTGQGMEIYSRDVEQCPTFEDYGVVVYGKSASPLFWGIQLLQLFAKNAKIDFIFEIFDKMGHFLQIYDDYINLHNPKYATVRVFADDLDEGKFSYPIIHAVRSHPDDKRLLNMLKQRPLDIESKKVFVEIMEGFGSFEFTRNVLENLRKGILADVEKMKLEKNPYLEKILEDIFSRLETEIYFDGCD
ncbi:hypothetical protein Zmor_018962 [Zophobas morio]|uniref:Geranylgeranyl pyrophosphate synthase n=2 Tax=Zophobas morio TaxID=2755281 RepID=A0AA38IDB7_9CUCU|nr:hypothetical protein Zmor_018962 [Zophobas morio]